MQFLTVLYQGHGKIVNISSVAGRESIQAQQSTRQQNMPLMLYLKVPVWNRLRFELPYFSSALLLSWQSLLRTVIEMFMKRGLQNCSTCRKSSSLIKYALEQTRLH